MHRLFQRRFFKFILINLFAVVLSSIAFSAESNVELEWEGVTNAIKYDLEVKTPKKTYSFSVKNPFWQGNLTPGIFQMRIRARDKRNVAGPWSGFQEFTVYLDAPIVTSPASDAVINSASDQTEKILVKWMRVPFAKKYIVDVRSEDNKISKQVVVNQVSTVLDLPVAQTYKLKVTGSNDILTSNSEKIKDVSFTIIGKKLVAPEIASIESRYVREMSWSKPVYAETFMYKLEKYDFKLKKFQILEENAGYAKNSLVFKKEWPGGVYRLSVSAQAQGRKNSDANSLRFSVIEGDRSATTEELATLRESIERLSGWFLTGSYLITSVDYTNSNQDMTNSTTKYTAIGGTARLGVGYVTKKNPWGYNSALEISTLDVEGFSRINYSTLELNSFFKTRPNDSGEFRQTLGVMYKELPDVGASRSGAIKINSVVTALGLRYGAEYWQAINSKIGLQANAQILPMVHGLKTTNSQALLPTVSYQAGLLASYRYSKNLTTLVGYAYRVDNADYKAKTNTNLQDNASKNSISLKGHYLNLLLEYQL